MKNKNSNQPSGAPKQEEQNLENEIIIAGATKKCPYCESDLPEKIAFCLYCMKPLIGNTVQTPVPAVQDNNGNCFHKTSTKIFIGLGALLAVAAIVVATSFITASILSRQGVGVHDRPHHQSEISGGHVFDGAEPILTPLPINLEPAPTPTPTPTATPNSFEQVDDLPTYLPLDVDLSAESSTSDGAQRGSRPSSPEISLERAIEIAYADISARGINASFRSNSGMSWERGQWVWELLFSTQGEIMPFIEYYISVGDGSIIKFEWDD